jgi:putative membrane-bound dehydrogenase-like protein
MMKNSRHSIRGIACIAIVTLSISLASKAFCHDGGLPQQVTIGEITFQIPDGCKLQKVADESLVKWPVVVDWDTKGNLLVVESGGVASPIEEHNKQALHKIIRLSDTDQDGDFDQRTVLVDQLPFTEGVLQVGHSIFACAPPNIWKFSDNDKDGSYETRDVWFDGQTITHCANDLHGPYLGRDGWIYWCKGAFGEQTHELRDGKKMTSEAAHIYRRHPDGGPIEPVITGGMDNPVEFTMTRSGEAFFDSTFLHHPGQGLRDGIAHAIHGSLFGKPHNVIDNATRTGGLMPVMVEFGPAAPSGLICLNQKDLIKDAVPNHDYLLCAQFNMQKVSVHELIPDGATFKANSRDIIVGSRIDFHPTDVLQDQDGSLIVVDTGGWYNLCCPTSKIDQKTAAGGIYRLQRSDLNNEMRPRKTPDEWHTVDPEWLTAFIHDPRPWVARCAYHQLRQLDDKAKSLAADMLAVQLSDSDRPDEFRLDALWAAGQLEHEAGQRLIRSAILDANPSVALAACHLVSLSRDQQAIEPIKQALKSNSPHVRRVAIEAYGRFAPASSRTIEPLLQAGRIPDMDRSLQHALSYASVGLADKESMQKAIALESSSQIQYALLIALEQLDATSDLESTLLASFLNSDDGRLSELAADILADQPHRVDEFMQELNARLAEVKQNKPLHRSLVTMMIAWRQQPQIIEAIGTLLEDSRDNEVCANQAIELLRNYERESIPVAWDAALTSWLDDANPSWKSQIASVAGRFELASDSRLNQALLRHANDSEDDLGALTLLAATTQGTACPEKLEARLIAALTSDDEGINQAAVNATARVQLSEASLQRLLDELDNLPPRSLAVAIEAINARALDHLDSQMLGKLNSLTAARTLSPDELRNMYRERSEELRSLATDTIDQLSKPPADIEAKVSARLSALPEGDIGRGMLVFRNQKTACAGCHKIGYIGGEIGPELSKIGGARTNEALLEAIMFPSARLEQSYHSTKVLTTEGQVYNGLIRKQIDANSFELQLTADKSIIIKKDEIEEMSSSLVSVMPAGLAELLTDQELSDLLAFLVSSK